MCNDGWDTKDDIVDFFARGDLNEYMLNKFITTSGDRAKIARALKKEVEIRGKSTGPMHVMMSHNWNQQPVAIELTTKLRSLGHDI